VCVLLDIFVHMYTHSGSACIAGYVCTYIPHSSSACVTRYICTCVPHSTAWPPAQEYGIYIQICLDLFVHIKIYLDLWDISRSIYKYTQIYLQIYIYSIYKYTYIYLCTNIHIFVRIQIYLDLWDISRSIYKYT